MAYRRFKLQDIPATVATTATLDDPRPQSVAEVATVAGGTAGNLRADPRTVADVAQHADEFPVMISIDLATDTAIALERTGARLRSMGCCFDEIQSRALAIVRADLRNSPALFIQQSDLNRCHVCGEREGEQPFIAVLSAVPERKHWLHPCCHAEHVNRLDARVDAVLRGLAPLLLADPPLSSTARYH